MADFARHQEAFTAAGIKLAAVSVDPQDKALEMVEKYRIRFAVACGADAVAVSAATGCFYDAGKGFLHAAGFLLDPEGLIINAVYSTGPLGRLEAETCLVKVEFERGKREA